MQRLAQRPSVVKNILFFNFCFLTQVDPFLPRELVAEILSLLRSILLARRYHTSQNYWSNIVSIHSGLTSEGIFVLNEDGELYASGMNFHNTLGLHDNANRNILTKVSTEPMVFVNSSKVRSFALNQKGDLFVTGFSNSEFVQVVELSNIISVACGLEHLLALNDKGQVFARGNNSSGQLGISLSCLRKSLEKFEMIKVRYHHIVAIDCGD